MQLVRIFGLLEYSWEGKTAAARAATTGAHTQFVNDDATRLHIRSTMCPELGEVGVV